MAASDFINVGSPWTIRASETFEYVSAAVGDKFSIGIWSPSEALLMQSAGKAPPLDVVYVLDGSFAFGLAAAICSLQYSDLINPGFAPVLLVGIDYPESQVNSRSRDYTMANSVPASLEEALSAIPQLKPGGAENFLAFLENELDPFIRSKYNTTDRPAGILGDSFGGTFTFYAFLKQSKIFDRYWLGSPAIFSTEADYIGKIEQRLTEDLVHPTQMFLSIGSLELNGGNEMYEELGRNYDRLVAALGKAGSGLAWKSKIYDGYTHTSVFAPALNDALLNLYGQPR